MTNVTRIVPCCKTCNLPVGDDFIVENLAFAPGDNRIYVFGDRLINTPSALLQLELLIFATR